MSTYLRPSGALLTGATALMLAVLPASAPAQVTQGAIARSTATAGMSYSSTSASTTIRVSLANNVFTIDDDVPIQPLEGCAAVAGDATKVTCAAFKQSNKFMRFIVGARQGDDRIENNTTKTNGIGAPMVAAGSDGDDVIDGGQADTVGFGGHDLVSYATSALPVVVDLNRSTPQGAAGEHDTILRVEDIEGSSFDDHLIGDAGSNRMLANGGNDLLEGNAGADALSGGDGDDVLMPSAPSGFGLLPDGKADAMGLRRVLPLRRGFRRHRVPRAGRRRPGRRLRHGVGHLATRGRRRLAAPPAPRPPRALGPVAS